ncbi:YaaC family protein [Paenarthrobacter nicotinovorans]|uniref:YaaC family protein n=1 Tax=Paenarthrobacter nicotinovorans TaxID=29320 RepID=UPI00382AFC65
MARRTGPESWRHLRYLRSSPVIADQKESLRNVFIMSLHQAEQQFAAARAIGVESRPLNIFYGLSQAGRALAAAFEARGARQGLELQGHGIKCINFGEVGVDPINRFARLGIKAHGSAGASFNKLSGLLESEPLHSATPIANLWGMLVEPQLHEPLGHTSHPVLLVEGDPTRLAPGQQDTISLSSIPGSHSLSDANEWKAFLRNYPSLSGSHLSRLTGRSVASGRKRETMSAEVTWQEGTLKVPLSATYSHYRGSKVVLPSPYSGGGSLHPLMIWWAVLFGLSMLCRYEPQTWTRVIDVNSSPHAVSIEYLLDVALESVPDVLAETLEAVLNPSDD